MAPWVRPSTRIVETEIDDAGGVENRAEVREDCAQQDPLDDRQAILGVAHAEQEHEEEDVIVEQTALEFYAARDEVISLDTG